MKNLNKEVVSIFNFRAYLIPILLTSFLILGVIILVNQSFKSNAEEIDFIKFWLPLLFSLVFFLGIVHEFRNKIINLKISKSSIVKRTYLGINKTYYLKDFDGFSIRTEKGKIESYEYLYLLKDGEPIITIAQTYIGNYYELKNMISSNSKNLGVSNYGLFNEIVDIICLK